MVTLFDTDNLEFEEYIDFLKRRDLGSQYPKQNFENRIRTLLKNVDICMTARDQKGTPDRHLFWDYRFCLLPVSYRLRR